MDFEKLCILFTMKEPYYGILLSSMDRIPRPEVKTMGVGKSGNVFRLYYNPAFVESLDTDVALECIKHEILHLAFNHFTIFNTEAKNEKEQKHRNIAADLEVNSYINYNCVKKQVDICIPSDFGWNFYEGTREYFNKLNQPSQQQQLQQTGNAQNPSQPCNEGQGGNSQSQSNQSQQSQQTTQNSQNQSSSGISGSASSGSNSSSVTNSLINSAVIFDDHTKWPTGDTQEQQELLQQTIDDLIVMAAEETEKACSTIPREMCNRVQIIREKKKAKPVADWKRFFRRFVGNEFSETIRKSKKRTSKRFDDAAGNRHRRKSRILVAIDTSGSINMKDYNEFFGQLKTLNQTATFHIVECDTDIRYEYDFKKIVPQTVHGHGGTNFQPVITLFKENYKKYDSLIYFTDGYATIPADTPKNTIWVISSDGDQSNREMYRKNGASVVFIPKH